eukprot:TRINITY_DN29861_c0_g1_i1.p1 TRINITY_DN29861_c0_g1~~TRINITY_DN29861_c0_g1_i1.p1  ORF type:complete len:507 (+),score=60.80 TRINITY_DN29861_c0_g1_i1:93-1613(+)
MSLQKNALPFRNMIAVLLHLLLLARGAIGGEVRRRRSSPQTTYCEYKCTGKPSPSKGLCLPPETSYQSRAAGYLYTKLKDDVIFEYWPAWRSMSAGDMSWEGWFKVNAPPAPDRSTLVGTYGPNHDGDLYSVEHRRRYGAIWVDTAGSLAMDTNVGESAGKLEVEAPSNVADGKWHHIAATWSRSGGAKITVSLKVINLNLRILLTRPALNDEFDATIMQAVAQVGQHYYYPAGMSIAYQDGQRNYIGAQTRYVWVQVTFICREDEAEAKRFMTQTSVVGAVENAIMTNTNLYIALYGGPATVEFENLPNATFSGNVGVGSLYVDGLPAKGDIIYSPLTDNMGMDEEFTVCGGHLGRTFDCEVSRFRLWDVALSSEQVAQLRGAECGLPSLPVLVGGPYPHGLVAEFTTTNNNTADPWQFGNMTVTGGAYGRGGYCDYYTCPAMQDYCPLHRQLSLNSMDECRRFVGFDFCRTSGTTRHRWPMHYFEGCHVGQNIQRMEELYLADH